MDHFPLHVIIPCAWMCMCVFFICRCVIQSHLVWVISLYPGQTMEDVSQGEGKRSQLKGRQQRNTWAHVDEKLPETSSATLGLTFFHVPAGTRSARAKRGFTTATWCNSVSRARKHRRRPCIIDEHSSRANHERAVALILAFGRPFTANRQLTLVKNRACILSGRCRYVYDASAGGGEFEREDSEVSSRDE